MNYKVLCLGISCMTYSGNTFSYRLSQPMRSQQYVDDILRTLEVVKSILNEKVQGMRVPASFKIRFARHLNVHMAIIEPPTKLALRDIVHGIFLSYAKEYGQLYSDAIPFLANLESLVTLINKLNLPEFKECS